MTITKTEVCRNGSGEALARSKSEQHKVRGWLLFFCASTTVYSLFFMFLAFAGAQLTINESVHGRAVLLGTFTMGLSLFSFLGLITAVKLWRVRPDAFKWLKAYFLISLLLVHFIWVLIWWPYFKRSRRVKATFGRNLGERTAKEDAA
jgi:hypothetical protein